MASLMKSMEFGLKTYLKEGAFGAYNKIMKSNFGADSDTAEAAGAIGGVAIVIILALAIGGIILGWLAVSHLCKGTDTRSKNIRLGLYAILLVTGGQVGWIYILLWLMKVNICA
jgi:hypothetical protein